MKIGYGLPDYGMYVVNSVREVYNEDINFFEEYPSAWSVIYEMLPYSELEPFLNEEVRNENQSPEFWAVYNAMNEYGCDSEEFLEKRFKYLGNIDMWYLTVHFDRVYNEKIFGRLGFDYKIILKNETDYDKATDFKCTFETILEDESAKGCCTFIEIPETEKEILNKLYTPQPIKKTIPSIGAISRTTRFGRVKNYYVGAALCIGLFDNTTNNTCVGFFDLGLNIGKTSSNAQVKKNSPRATANFKTIISLLNTTTPPDIIISHWHDDHINLALALVNDPNFANFWANSNWYVPQTTTPSHAEALITGAIPKNHCHIQPNATPPVYPVTAPLVSPGSNVNIRLVKIDYSADKHPHHHGIYAKITLSSGKTVFLPGDNVYCGIDVNDRTNNKNGWDYMSACHHGGNYAVKATRDINDIPLPKDKSVLVYSANGYKYGHPATAFMFDHMSRLWKGYARLDQLIGNLLSTDFV
jgi:hypothetical protein